MLARYFDTSRSLIERYGGVVDKFIGNVVGAAWGTPVANEDDAERAVAPPSIWWRRSLRSGRRLALQD